MSMSIMACTVRVSEREKSGIFIINLEKESLTSAAPIGNPRKASGSWFKSPLDQFFDKQKPT